METGGAQVLTVSLLNEMCIAHDVYLVVINNKFNASLLKQLNRKVKVFLISRRKGSRNPIPIIRLNLLLRRLDPDIIHCHEAKAAQVVWIQKAKLLHTIHDVGLPTSRYSSYDKLIAISDAVCEDVASHYGPPVQVIYNGIPVDLFERRKDYFLKTGGCIKLVQVSRLVHEKKGQDVLLRALHELKSQYNCTDFSLDFIGAGSSLDFLEKLALELDLGSSVRFLGDRSRDWLFAHLAGYHILVQPSRMEGFGLTILEGFAAGLPVLASNTGGPAEVLSHVPGGFLFDNSDSRSCAHMLDHISGRYKNSEVGELMDRTINEIQNKYSIKACSSQYLEAYHRLQAS